MRCRVPRIVTRARQQPTHTCGCCCVFPAPASVTPHHDTGGHRAAPDTHFSRSPTMVIHKSASDYKPLGGTILCCKIGSALSEQEWRGFANCHCHKLWQVLPPSSATQRQPYTSQHVTRHIMRQPMTHTHTHTCKMAALHGEYVMCKGTRCCVCEASLVAQQN